MAVVAAIPAFVVAGSGGGVGIAVAGLILAVVVAIVAALAVTAGIVAPLDELSVQVGRAAEGDLNAKLPAASGDEVGGVVAAFSSLLAHWRKFVGQVNDSAAQIAAASNQLGASATKIASNANTAAEQSAGAASTSGGMAQTAGDIAENCNVASVAAAAATEAANTSAYVSMESINSINAIADRVKASSECIGRLGQRSDQIGAIVSTIKDIAAQTNLLALNAAIEAARAGEMGRGFAVVADEVRKLAERTTQATQQISEMIKLIQTETHDAVASMEMGVQEVEKGVAEGARASESICEILGQITELSNEIGKIAAAAEEQRLTTGDISANIQKMSSVVQGSAGEAQAVSSAAAALSRQADQLMQLARNYKL